MVTASPRSRDLPDPRPPWKIPLWAFVKGLAAGLAVVVLTIVALVLWLAIYRDGTNDSIPSFVEKGVPWLVTAIPVVGVVVALRCIVRSSTRAFGIGMLVSILSLVAAAALFVAASWNSV